MVTCLFNPVLNCVRNYGVLEMAILVRHRKPKPTITRELRLTYGILLGAKEVSGTIWRVYKYVRDLGLDVTHMTIYNKVYELRGLGLIKTREVNDSKGKRILVEITDKGQQLLHSLRQIFS